MIQDIAPKKLINDYKTLNPRDNGKCFVFNRGEVLLKIDNGQVTPPEFNQVAESIEKAVYLFCIDDQEYYLASLKDNFIPRGFEFVSIQKFRELQPKDVSFALMTAYHLYIWYRDNQFCGRCGHPVVQDQKERMLKCTDCGNMIFPKIAPAVITAVTDKDRIIMTKYNGRTYVNFALIAGFTEIGETAEETVKREVLEEVGLHVKNIKYYGSQPWGKDSNLLLGYFAELDGNDTIDFDSEELSMAKWYSRDEIELKPDDISLTNEMIQAFAKGEINY